MNPANAGQGISPFPAPPEYAQHYTTENLKAKAFPPFPPPPVQTDFVVFGEEYHLDDEIIRPLTAQGMKQLYPAKYDWKTEMKKLNRSVVAAFLDLLDILIKCPDHSERVEKLNDIQTIFINMHHLVNEYRPIQARDSLKYMQSQQLDLLETNLRNFRDILNKGRVALKEELSLDGLQLEPVPRPSSLTGVEVDSEDDMEMPRLETEVPMDVDSMEDSSEKPFNKTKSDVSSFKERQRTEIGFLGNVRSRQMDPCSRRLVKELQQLCSDPPAGISVDANVVQSNIKEWHVGVRGAKGTLYDGEEFILQFKFGAQYPFHSPEVMFTGDNIPVHPHIYSNGHICLSILADDWTPALSVQAVCLSILSMLSSAREKKHPPDNALYIRTCNKNPSKTRWWFHDDTV